jgi:hypothetical protein
LFTRSGFAASAETAEIRLAANLACVERSGFDIRIERSQLRVMVKVRLHRRDS